MPKFIKEVGNSISATLTATTAVTQSVAKVVTTIADASSNTVEPIVGMVSDVATVGRSYTEALVLDAEAEKLLDLAKREDRVESMTALLADKDVRKKLKEQYTVQLMEDLFD